MAYIPLTNAGEHVVRPPLLISKPSDCPISNPSSCCSRFSFRGDRVSAWSGGDFVKGRGTRVARTLIPSPWGMRRRRRDPFGPTQRSAFLLSFLILCFLTTEKWDKNHTQKTGPASSSQQEKQATAPPASSSDAGAGSSLFRGLVFYIAREVPREPLLLLLRSFGADAVSWEGPGAPLKVDDPRITHAIVDKPPAVPSSNRGGGASTAPPPLPPRASVVPQWAFDSANFRVRADERRYLPGRRPPPHLSPFADAADDGGYVPAYAEELKAQREASSSAARGARAVAAKDALAEFEAAAAAVAERGGSGDASAGAPAADGGGGEKAPDAIDADEAAAAAAHAEGLAKELGMSLPTTAKSKKAAAKVSGDDGDDDAVESAADVAKAADADRMRAAMLPRKKRHLYESVRKAQDAKKARGEKLAEKAAAVASK